MSSLTNLIPVHRDKKSEPKVESLIFRYYLELFPKQCCKAFSTSQI